MDEVLRFYAPGDFHDMARTGMNTVHIPVPCREFHDNVIVNGDFPCMVSRLLDRAKGAGLKMILVPVGGTGEDILGLGLSMEERREAPPPDNNNTTTNATVPPQDAPSLINLFDSLWRDILALFLVNDASLSTSTSMAVGRGRPEDAPSSPSLYDYYAVRILARFPPRNWVWRTAVRRMVAMTTKMPTVPPLLSATLAYDQTKA